jgi:DNA-3-methyladenine glycosylase II
MTARAQEIRTGLAWLHAADPVLAGLIDERPDFDPDAWIRRLPAMGLFGALVFAIIGQQISVIAATVLDLAQRFSDGRLSAGELSELPDQEVIGQLTAVKGIGAWTVQGALLIALRRPDVVRPDDLALRRAIRARYGLDRLPTPAEVADLAERWRPYRSLASSLQLTAARPG